jgi:outer membrane lipoprotein-sorting protein
MNRLVVLTIVLTAFAAIISAQDAKQIIKKADEKWQGTSQYSEMKMEIIRPTWKRTVVFKGWGLGRDYSLTYVSAPAREKGQTFLKRKNEMWTWNPKIRRLIKLPPSMMSQGWMGSDFTNDDILKESSMVVDYSHKLIGKETVSGISCYKIELIPLEDASVVWGKIIKWISIDEFDQMKSEYYDEDDMLVKTDIAYDIKLMSDRKIPTRLEIIPADEEGHKTVVHIIKMQYGINKSESFFSQQNMKRIK